MSPSRKLAKTGITRNGVVPAYYQIAGLLKSAMEEGRLRPGDELPAEKDMADRFGVNRLTVRRAIQELATQGLVVRSQGRRSRVASEKIPLDPFGSFAAQVAAHGYTARTEVYECAMGLPLRDLKPILPVKARERVLHIARVRYLGKMPVAVEDNYLCRQYATPFTETQERAERLYESLRKHCGLDVWDVDAAAEMRAADKAEAAMLDVREGQALFALRLTLSSKGKSFGYTNVRFLADRFHFRLGLQRYPVKH